MGGSIVPEELEQISLQLVLDAHAAVLDLERYLRLAWHLRNDQLYVAGEGELDGVKE